MRQLVNSTDAYTYPSDNGAADNLHGEDKTSDNIVSCIALIITPLPFSSLALMARSSLIYAVKVPKGRYRPLFVGW